MKTTVIGIALLPIFAGAAMAQTQESVIPGHYSTVGCPGQQSVCFIPNALVQPIANSFQQISPSVTTSLTVPTSATTVWCTVEGTSIRVRDDGGTPTATVGFPVAVGASLVYTGPLTSLQMIQTAAGATVDCLYYR